MKTLLITCVFLFAGACGRAPSSVERDWRLPTSLAVKLDGPQAYRFTVDYYNLDVKGRVGGRERVSGLYTRGLPGNEVQWTDVTVATSTGLAGQFGPGEKRDFMEGLSYPLADPDIGKSEFFRGFPPTAMQERNLVWDTRMFEIFGQDNFQHLVLNTPYHFPDAADVPLAGAGTFHQKDVQLIWTGISKRNGQECAVIDYQAFFNNFEIQLPGFNLIGRSHYWGQIWVSLAAKQIEYATLYEDVLGEAAVGDQRQAQTVNVFRIGVFEPVKER